jgi:hypothetical protein
MCCAEVDWLLGLKVLKIHLNITLDVWSLIPRRSKQRAISFLFSLICHPLPDERVVRLVQALPCLEKGLIGF